MGSGRQARRSNTNFNRLRRLTKSQIHKINDKDQSAFDAWLASKRKSKQSQQDDLPSSNIIPKAMLINKNIPQLFVVIDTCSIVSNRPEFIDYVVRLKEIFPKNASPIKFIISLTVLEELDKFNRNPKRKSGAINSNVNGVMTQQESANNSNKPQITTPNSNPSKDPPRMFMRFIEEEMRSSDILISELDPYKKSTLSDHQRFEVLTKDDRILFCCVISQSFLKANESHEETKVILVSEDNVFKSKATTFDVASYRWKEFEAKFKNFGHKHYVSTPMPSTLAANRSSLPLFNNNNSNNQNISIDSNRSNSFDERENYLQQQSQQQQPDNMIEELISIPTYANTDSPEPAILGDNSTSCERRKIDFAGSVFTKSFYRLLNRPEQRSQTEDESVIIVKEVINIK